MTLTFTCTQCKTMATFSSQSSTVAALTDAALSELHGAGWFVPQNQEVIRCPRCEARDKLYDRSVHPDEIYLRHVGSND